MLSGATASARAMLGTAVLRIVVSSACMKNATATSHGSSSRRAPPAAVGSSVALTRGVLSSRICVCGRAAPKGRRARALERLASGERVRQRAAIDVLELPAHRHPVGDAARADAAARGELAQVVGGRLALDG